MPAWCSALWLAIAAGVAPLLSSVIFSGHLDAVLLNHFLELTVADRVRHIPADGLKNYVPLKMTALELDHHLLAAETVARNCTPGGLVGQICDRTACDTSAPAMAMT